MAQFNRRESIRRLSGVHAKRRGRSRAFHRDRGTFTSTPPRKLSIRSAKNRFIVRSPPVAGEKGPADTPAEFPPVSPFKFYTEEANLGHDRPTTARLLRRDPLKV